MFEGNTFEPIFSVFQVLMLNYSYYRKVIGVELKTSIDDFIVISNNGSFRLDI